MRVSAKTEYACIAMLELAAHHGSKEPVRIREIAERHGIPARFLVQILLQLKGAGLVTSTRGAAGGYQLLRPPDEVSLGEVMGVIEGPLDESAHSVAAASPLASVLSQTWRELSQLEQETLHSLSFAELVERARHQHESMYYI